MTHLGTKLMKQSTDSILYVLFVSLALLICTSCVLPVRPVTTKTGLKYEVILKGRGPAAVPGQFVRIHETTTLADGTLLYSTHTKNNPLKFQLGSNQAIAGVDEGVTGMRVGERRKLIVPPALSKRSVYPAHIPPDATLYYAIELVEILEQ
jgi:FKBP-type peptidyl-prolyl cis-trans isomerase